MSVILTNLEISFNTGAEQTQNHVCPVVIRSILKCLLEVECHNAFKLQRCEEKREEECGRGGWIVLL